MIKDVIRFQKHIVFILVFSLLFYSCKQRNVEFSSDKVRNSFSIDRINDSLFYLHLQQGRTLDSWELSYPVYRLDTGDVDQDGIQDALVGVIKKTRFDSVTRKRLFIFKNYKGYIRPLWLGSSLGQPLVDFRFLSAKEGSRIRSIEKEKTGKYLLAEYKWRSFGLEFVRYIQKEVDSATAVILLNE